MSNLLISFFIFLFIYLLSLIKLQYLLQMISWILQGCFKNVRSPIYLKMQITWGKYKPRCTTNHIFTFKNIS